MWRNMEINVVIYREIRMGYLYFIYMLVIIVNLVLERADERSPSRGSCVFISFL